MYTHAYIHIHMICIHAGLLSNIHIHTYAYTARKAQSIFSYYVAPSGEYLAIKMQKHAHPCDPCRWHPALLSETVSIIHHTCITHAYITYHITCTRKARVPFFWLSSAVATDNESRPAKKHGCLPNASSTRAQQLSLCLRFLRQNQQ